MTKLQIQIDDLVRDMTDEEEENYYAKELQSQAQEQAKAEAKAAAQAKLAALGLSVEDLQALGL
jgi:hypothetical protein